MANPNKALRRLFALEGYDFDHPKDPGGETYYGISKNFWPEYYEEWGGPPTKEQAEDFYFCEFWQPLMLDDIHDQRIADELFEQAVNLGKSRAVKLCRYAYNAITPTTPVDVNGQVDMKLVNRINKLSWNDTQRLFKTMNGLQFTFFLHRTDQLDKALNIFSTTSDPEMGVFFRGWLRRVGLDE